MEANLIPSESVLDDQFLEETYGEESTSPNGNSEVDVEGDVDDGIPPGYYSITSYGADYPIDGLIKRLDRGDIIIPKFQRSYVWKIEQASRLIESFLLGLPVPGIFLARENETNKLIVIDGQQRLKSCCRHWLRFSVASDALAVRCRWRRLERLLRFCLWRQTNH